MCGPGLNLLESSGREGDTPVCNWASAAYDLLSKSRIAWECNLNREVNSFQS